MTQKPVTVKKNSPMPKIDNNNFPIEANLSSAQSFFSKTKKGMLWGFIFLLLLSLSIFSGLFIYQAGNRKNITSILKNETNEATGPQIAPAPSPTPVDLANYTVEVLNGSGKIGEAAKVKKLLEGENFVVSSIGNATSSSERTIFSKKPDTPQSFVDSLVSILEKDYLLAPEVETSDTQSFDMIIIIGQTLK